MINSIIVKTSKLTKAAVVYRGIAGGRLPADFYTPNQYNFQGGVEKAFMSTTYDRSVAMAYATRPDQPAVIFEMQMGMVDRGCELEWLSQYPHEREVLFNPLTGLEVRAMRIEGLITIVELKLSVNLSASTIDQVVRKRRMLVDDIATNMTVQVRNDPIITEISNTEEKAAVARVFDTLLEHETQAGALSREAAWYNNDSNFKRAINEVIQAKEDVINLDTRFDILTVRELRKKHTLPELKAAGFVQKLKENGVLYQEALEAKYSTAELRRAGFAPCPSENYIHEHLFGDHGRGVCSRCGAQHRIGPEVWRKGGCELGKPVVMKIAQSFNMLQAFPKDRRLVAAGSPNSKRDVTIYGKGAKAVTDRVVLGEVSERHRADVRSVATDGKHVVSGDSEGEIRLWLASSHALLGVLHEAHGGRIFGVAVQGDDFVSGGADKMVKLWSVRELEQRKQTYGKDAKDVNCRIALTDHQHLVFDVDVSHDYIASVRLSRPGCNLCATPMPMSMPMPMHAHAHAVTYARVASVPHC